jgi:N-acetylmuramoyl-L-alanine amidase
MIRLVPCGSRGHRGRRLLVSLLLVVTAPLWGPSLIAEGTPETLYTTALVRERGLREPGVRPSLNDLRAAISGYEEIVRRFPRSAFDDHSLWQGAGLALEAYERYRQEQDLETGVRLLSLLSVNHPTSSFAGRVPNRLRRLDALTDVARLTAISRETLPDAVRVTITLDREVSFHSEHLSDPSRWFVDLRGTQAAPELRNSRLAFTEDADVIRTVRLGRHPNQVTRVVLDAENTDGCHAFTLYEPFRLVVDCRRTLLASQSVVATGAGPPAASPAVPIDLLQPIGHVVAPVAPLATAAASAVAPVAMLEVDALSVAKLDQIPAIGSVPSSNTTGVYSVARQLGLGISREVVLDLALRLEQRIHSTQPELEVVLTRRTDEYLPLEARTTLANHVGADLFLSIHANASKDTRTRGIETYYLDLAVDPKAEALAARENVGGLATMNHLDDLLQAIASNSKLDESRALAETVQRTMLHTLRSVDPEIPDLGVKRAPFVVLIGARMPSILAEVSFLTNSKDATMLSTAAYRDLIVDALLAAIQQYQQSLGTEPVLALADAGDF